MEIPFLLHRLELEQKNNEKKKKTVTETVEHTTTTGQKPFMYQITADNLNKQLPSHLKERLTLLPSTNIKENLTNVSMKPTIAATSSNFTNTTSVEQMIQHQIHNRQRVFSERNPFTYTVEEWAENEIKAGRLQQASKPVLPKALIKEEKSYILNQHDQDEREQFFQQQEQPDEEQGNEQEENEHEENDEKRAKTIYWDNYKDDNEKGAGAKYTTHSLYNLDKKYN